MPDAAASGWNWRRALWLLAIAILCARLGFVLLHQPLVGFANQFDMLRNTGCLGLQPDVDAPTGMATPEAPIARYRVGMAHDPSCLIGTEVAIASLALGLDAVGDAVGLGDPLTMPLRLVGWTKALLLLLALAFVDRSLRAWPQLRLVHAWVAALILVDPFNTLYLAGFYTEFAALLSTYLSLALPLLWLLARRVPSTPALLIWGLALAALALARFQHALIPFAILAWWLLLARVQGWSWPRLAGWPLLILIPALALQLGLQRQYQTIADANRWNSFFGAALPAVDNAPDFIAHLELPAACAELTHTTWYLQRGRDARVECPQAFALSRLSWALQLAQQPTALARLFGRGIALSGQWRPTYLGELAQARFQRMSSGPLGVGASLSNGVARLPFSGLLCLWIWPLVLVAFAWPQRRASSRPGRPFSELLPDLRSAQAIVAIWLWPLLLLIVALGWASSVLGDGYSELARHLHLAANAALVAVLLGVLHFASVLQRRSPGWGRALLTGLVPALLLVAGLQWWIAAQSLGFGVLEVPQGESAAGQIDVHGWALDPRGIERIDLVFADGNRKPLTLSARPELAGIFGGGIGRHGRDFSGRIEAASTQKGELAIEVIPLSGAPTIIDRRWLR
jgi:hypothetical protein